MQYILNTHPVSETPTLPADGSTPLFISAQAGS